MSSLLDGYISIRLSHFLACAFFCFVLFFFSTALLGTPLAIYNINL